jgi:flagellin
VGANADQTIDHTISVFGLGNVDGAVGTSTIASGTAVSATAATAAVNTLTLAGTYAAGDVITVNLNENMFRFTVTSDALTTTAVADAMVTALNAKFSDDFTVAATTDGILDIKRAAVADTTTGNSFTLTAKASDGEWDDIASLEIGTQTNANTAITTLDVALTSVNDARAALGSVINRLTYAADNLANVSQNTSASRSRVMDTDYAKATTDLAKSQIIQQAATAMLAQANQQPSAVLSLLQ